MDDLGKLLSIVVVVTVVVAVFNRVLVLVSVVSTSTPAWQNITLGQFVKDRNIAKIAFSAQRGSW